MKIFKIIVCFLSALQLSLAQSIDIGVSASIEVGTGADICAGFYGNITGNLTGDGTQCGQYPLPVELSLFTASVKDQKVILYWKTETEVNNFGFLVQKRSMSTDWDSIAFILGNGNSNAPKEYNYADDGINNKGNKFLYRLKQIDNDGTFEYSNVVEVEITTPSTFSLEQNYPNPFNPSTKIRYTIPSVIAIWQLPEKQSQLVSLKVYDVLGKEVATLVNEEQTAGTYEVEFSADQLTSGLYFYTLQAGSYIETKKMILLK